MEHVIIIDYTVSSQRYRTPTSIEWSLTKQALFLKWLRIFLFAHSLQFIHKATIFFFSCANNLE